jgi:hypothetical protein
MSASSQFSPLEGQSQRLTIGTAILSPRFSRLDRDRQSSMANEGGTAGAILDSEDYLQSAPLFQKKKNSLPLSNNNEGLKKSGLIFTSSLIAIGIGYTLIKKNFFPNKTTS